MRAVVNPGRVSVVLLVCLGACLVLWMTNALDQNTVRILTAAVGYGIAWLGFLTTFNLLAVRGYWAARVPWPGLGSDARTTTVALAGLLVDVLGLGLMLVASPVIR